jgi:Tryptophan-associated transmembrane protein (Trp_oprn_chp)
VTLDKKRSAAVVLVPALALIGLSTLTWATGEAKDVLSRGVVDVSGGSAAPGMVGLAVVCIVALLGVMTGGRLIRAVSAAVLVLASLGTVVMTLVVALRPVDTVADAVARELARTTSPATTGSTTPWVWVALLLSVILTAGAVATALSSRSWAGLSGRYERGSRPQSGPRGEVRTAWDELSDGHDPTLRDAPDETEPKT